MAGPENIYVRMFEPKDWPIFKELRLEALKAHPDLFGGSYEDSAARSDDEWIAFLDGRNQTQIFGLFDEEMLIGITGICPWDKDPSGKTGRFIMSYIKPDYRRKGLSALLYTARIGWARETGAYTKLVNGHRESNEPSKRAQLTFGFRETHREPLNWADGTDADCVWYALDLNTEP